MRYTTPLTWDNFVYLVKHGARYTILSQPADELSTLALGVVQSIFESAQRDGLLQEVPAGKAYWRGRTRDCPPPSHYGVDDLGPVPSACATANRMSPTGISMFYGSDDVETALAEVVAHKRRSLAVLAAFELVRPIVVLDFANIPRGRASSLVGDILLHEFVGDLRKPVEFDGREHIEYMPTQIVTEYFRRRTPVEVDGILFRSVHQGGANCVLFAGPDACALPGHETDQTVLRYLPSTRHTVDTPG
jgi:hypothetical protein